MRPIALLAAALLAFGTGAWANEATDSARAAKMIAEAKTALESAVSPRRRIAALGLAAQAQEAVLKALRADIQILAARRAGLDERAVAERARLAAVLAALLRLERAPKAAAIAHPDGVVAAARAGMTLAAFTPALEVEAAKIRVALDEIEAVEARREVAISEARASLGALREIRAEVARLVDEDRRRRRLPEELLARMDAEAAALSRSAASLEALAGALPPSVAEAGIAEEAARRPAFSAAARDLEPPVEGRLMAGFEQAGEPGVIFQAPAWAEIYAPWDSVVRFAGPFGDYGGVAILEPEPGVLIVLAGLNEIRRKTGDTVLRGESIGALGGPPPATEEFLIAASTELEATPPETLYMEVRKGGDPVDPAKWFALVTEKR